MNSKPEFQSNFEQICHSIEEVHALLSALEQQFRIESSLLQLEAQVIEQIAPKDHTLIFEDDTQ
jgi:flavin reductase (DIM6/NTAB) family NADH-FMN oxidoreductase RutF